MNQSNSERLFAQAQQYIPGGVNSPVRSFRAVEGTPPFIARGQGSRVWDVDGNEYIDYVCSWGPLALGHAHPAVVEALQEASGRALALRQLPIVDGETVAGYVDLASERAYKYKTDQASDRVDIPDDAKRRILGLNAMRLLGLEF